jgi:hypothetical protein
MIADWKTMDSAPRDFDPSSGYSTIILVCDQWDDVWVVSWNQGKAAAGPAGWREGDSDEISIKPEDESAIRWDHLPAGYVTR